VPGQVFYNASRKLILKGVDGIILVADSQFERMDANLESIRNLNENLSELNFDIADVPYVLQLNKRDLPGAVPLEQMRSELLLRDEPVYEAVATRGDGVLDTLKCCAKLVLKQLKNKIG
jgi:signal recognition particle receptor subunit beta